MRTAPFTIWIPASPFSKANSRRLVKIGGAIRSIKSEKALGFVDVFNGYCPVLDPVFTEDVHVDIDAYYEDRRRDLDESLVLDCLQGPVIKNDRLIKSRRVRWNLSKDRPGVHIHVRLAEPEDYAQSVNFPLKP